MHCPSIQNAKLQTHWPSNCTPKNDEKKAGLVVKLKNLVVHIVYDIVRT